MLELEGERRSNLALLPGIIDQPGRTLAQVLEHPRKRWILPFLLSIIGLALVLGVSASYLSQQAQEQQAVALQQVQGQLDQMTESQRAQMEATISRFTSPAFVGGIGFATSLGGLLLGWLLGAAILFFGLQMGGKGLQFGQIFAGFSWTWLPFILRDLLNAGWVLLNGKIITNPGLSYFFASGDVLADAKDFRWVLASKLDLFMLWHIVLVYFLARAANKRGGGLGLTLVYALIILALRVLPSVALSSLSIGG